MTRPRDGSNAYFAFAVIAQEYCAVLEDQSIHGEYGLTVVRNILLRLYGAAIVLPLVDSTGLVEGKITHEQAHALYKDLQKRFPIDFYRDTFDPLKDGAETVASSLADDLTDIWRDLKNGLLALDSGPNPIAEGVWWEWRFSFQTHWGRHAIGALRAVHYALQDA